MPEIKKRIPRVFAVKNLSGQLQIDYNPLMVIPT